MVAIHCQYINIFLLLPDHVWRTVVDHTSIQNKLTTLQNTLSPTALQRTIDSSLIAMGITAIMLRYVPEEIMKTWAILSAKSIASFILLSFLLSMMHDLLFPYDQVSEQYRIYLWEIQRHSKIFFYLLTITNIALTLIALIPLWLPITSFKKILLALPLLILFTLQLACTWCIHDCWDGL